MKKTLQFQILKILKSICEHFIPNENLNLSKYMYFWRKPLVEILETDIPKILQCCRN